MATAKTLALYFLVGALIGTVVVSLVLPGIMAWDNTPRMGQGLCPCGDTTRHTANALLVGQAEGAAAGGVVLLTLGIVLEVRKRKKAAASPAAAPTG